MKTAFIGGGVMAEAIISRATTQGVLHAADVCVAEPVAERRTLLADRYGVSTSEDNLAAVGGARLVVLAVKPQHLPEVFDGLAGKLSPEQTVLSIVAGATLTGLTSGLGHRRVVRVMPNTPARVGEGVSVWIATPDVDAEARQAATELLAAMGTQLYVDDEAVLDMATAVSGSGPAYVFGFMEALADAAVDLGIPREMAQALVLQTVLGSAVLAKEAAEAPALLREKVTSPGGTTAEALKTLEHAGFRDIIRDAVKAAYAKAQALGREGERGVR